MKSQRKRSDTGSLARSAGRAASLERLALEPLEARKLLFAFTVTPGDDPDGDGVGEVTATWGYTIPLLFPIEEPDDDTDPEVVDEPFDDDPLGPIASGQILLESDIRVRHNFGGGSSNNFRITEVTEGDRFVQVNAANGNFFEFLPLSVSDTGGQVFDRSADSMSFTIADADNQGMLPNGFRVDFFFFDQLVASFSGTDLLNANTSGSTQDRLRGIGTFVFDVAPDGTDFVFTRARVSSTVTEDFTLDNLTMTIPVGVFAEIIESRIFGATMIFRGPVGASIDVRDLYGRSMRNTIALGTPEGSDLTIVDLDDDGVPDFNDGIGSIRMSGVDARASLVIIGGTITYDTATGFLFTLADSLLGQFDAFEGAGMGYHVEFDDQNQPTVFGLPPGPGSVIIGSPFVRDNTNAGTYNPDGGVGSNIVTNGFNRGDQGIFVDGGESFGEIFVHGMVHGTSRFTGAVDAIYFGAFNGSLNITGDLGSLSVGSDAGMWTSNDGAENPVSVETNSQYTIGRTAGQINIAGRSNVSVNVLGDLSSPQARAPRDSFRYYEREVTFGFEQADNPEQSILNRIYFSTLLDPPQSGLFFPTDRYTPIFGANTFRNDTLLGAEIVNSGSSAAQIFGSIGFGDPINANEDGLDIYGFAVDGTRDVSIELNLDVPHLVRIVDENGRTVAANELLRSASLLGDVLTFRPDHAGVYYLVITDVGVNATEDDDQLGAGVTYAIVINGLAPVTLGSYRTGGAMSRLSDTVLNIGAGSLGSVRIGTGYVDGAGTDIDPSASYNADGDIEDEINMLGGTINVPANLYNMTVGSDIAGGSIIVGGNFGSLITGMNPAVGGAAGDGLEGDVSGLDLRVGGSVGILDIKGAVGINQDEPDLPFFLFGFDIRTGTSGGGGDIGMIRIGSHVAGGRLLLRTSPGSTVGGILINQDNAGGDGDSGIYNGDFDISDIITGLGSDIRFADFPRIDSFNTPNNTIQLRGDNPVELVDDAGGVVRIEIEGAPQNIIVGLIRVLPVDGAEGVAIAQLDQIDLSGGRRLKITSLGRNDGSSTGAPISIGRINITGADALSQIIIQGQVEVDVWRIVQTGGGAFLSIINQTPLGDLVAVDVVGLTRLEIQTGDLGRTQVPGDGPRLIGPFLGLAVGHQGGVGQALGADGAVFSDAVAGGLRPIADFSDTNFMEDMGAPFDPYLNGLVVRTGNVQLVRVGGAVGDVILQGGDLTELLVDADRSTPSGRFDGIVGTIYAISINRVDVGGGLADNDGGPMLTTGIFATDEIRFVEVNASRHAGAFLSSVIVAGDVVVNTIGPNGVLDVQGIARITAGAADLIDIFIGASSLDDFWISFSANDARTGRGRIADISGTSTDMFRAEVLATDIDRIGMTGGAIDASRIQALQNIGEISAQNFRNSTLTGFDREFHVNEIIASENFESLSATEDISDLTVQAGAEFRETISARNITRLNLAVDANMGGVAAAGSIRASRLSAGSFGGITVGDSIRTSQIAASGLLGAVAAAGEIFNSSFTVSGPSGEITSITAVTRLTGSVNSSGPVGPISSSAGDVILEIATTGANGTLSSLTAARDLILDADISRNVQLISAGRHIGRAGSSGLLVVHGDLPALVAGGHLFTDVRVGGVLTSATIGAVANKPGSILPPSGSLYAKDRIVAVTISGDFGGHIVSYTNGIGSVVVNNGSLLTSGSVAAFDGNIGNVTINNGNLYGDIFSDRIIFNVTLNAGADGIFGDIGVNPNLSNAVYDSLRSQRPPGVAPTTGLDGPAITAGWNIGRIFLTGGSIFEAVIHAGRAIGTIDVRGDIARDGLDMSVGTVIAAGDTIASVLVTGNIGGAQLLAGVRSLGADRLPGGFAANADTIKSGSILGVAVAGNFVNSRLAAGVIPGVDRVYNTNDDEQALGLSSIDNISVGGVGTNTTVSSDSLGANATAGGKLTALALRPTDDSDLATGSAGAEIASGATLNFSNASGSGIITFTGPGRAFFDSATSRVILLNTTSASSINVVSSGTLTDFDVVSNVGASMGLVRIAASLAGDSDVVIDGSVASMVLGFVGGTGAVRVGDQITSFVSGPFLARSLQARHVPTLLISGNLGDPDADVRGETVISLLSADAIRVVGAMRGAISAQRFISTLTLGVVEGGLIRAGSVIGTLTASSLARSRVSSGDFINAVNIAGDMTDSSIQGGGDLGDDAEVGGTGFNADSAGAGFIGPVTVGGDFVQSDIVAGFLRGVDGFFGTVDDLLASGNSSLASVAIAGEALGSNRTSESYRIASTGTLGSVTEGGAPASNDRNFRITTVDIDPLPIQINSVDVRQTGGSFVATLTANQPLDFSSVLPALAISEVRGNGEIEIRLIEDLDYTLAYRESDNAILVTFASAIIRKDLPQQADQPAPGVFRFTIGSDIVRGRSAQARMDGNGDGRVEADEDFSSDNIVGDIGDKLENNSVDVTDTAGQTVTVDFYAPVNLSIILDDNRNPDGLPDPNEVFTVRGAIGDHPDANADVFGFAGDTDVFLITLRAGQILRLGDIQGPANAVGRALILPDGSFSGGFNDFVAQLPSTIIEADRLFDATVAENYLVKQTGAFYIVVTNAGFSFNDPDDVPNIDPVPNAVGEYSFTVEVFDDSDSGFGGETNSGDGQDLVNAPSPSAFAGEDDQLGTADDLSSITIGEYTFTYNAGVDGSPNTLDDFVSGSNGSNVTSVTNALGAHTVTVDAAVGNPGFSGIPSSITPDADVFHLNSGNPIATGTVVRVTFKLNDLGADFGSRLSDLLFDFSSAVQVGVFDTSTTTGASDALLVLSPSDFSPNGGGTPGTIAESDNAAYGFDDNGDFFLEFVAAGRLDRPGQNASYAVYVQGLFNTDYRLEVVTAGTQSVVRRRQNILIETGGGEIDWLEAGGIKTPIGEFLPSAVGFVGDAPNGQPVEDYILDNLVESLQDMFDSVVAGAGSDGIFGTSDDPRGLDITVSVDPQDFEFQDFSTIFLSSSLDPVNLIFDTGLGVFLTSPTGFTQPFGYSEHVDAGNADRNDEAVVLVPSFAILGYTPSADDLDEFVTSLTAAVGRRAGELMGLRITADTGSGDVMAASSVVNTPNGGVYSFLSSAVALSPEFDLATDSDFFLGTQNAAVLLSSYIRARD